MPGLKTFSSQFDDLEPGTLEQLAPQIERIVAKYGLGRMDEQSVTPNDDDLDTHFGAEFDIIYGKGISKVGEIIDLCVEHELIKKSGSWYAYGDTKLGQGRDAVKDILNDNPELMQELESKVIEAL